MRELWRSARSVTTFVRHFGCLFYHQAVDDLLESLPQILRRNARVVIVGNGSIAQAARLYAEKALPRDGVDVVTDPEREAYRAADLERGVARTFLNAGPHARTGKPGARATA